MKTEDEMLRETLDAVAGRLTGRGWTLATAESCTGGWVAKVCTDRAGSSNWFDRGFVTYSNAAKIGSLGVDPVLLDRHGAVSEPVAKAMAEGALRQSGADVALSVTGIAGPDGGTADKPVGTVWFAWACRGQPTSTEMRHFDGDRERVRRQSVSTALTGLLSAIRGA